MSHLRIRKHSVPVVDGIWGKKENCKAVQRGQQYPQQPFHSSLFPSKTKGDPFGQQGQHTACLITLGILQSSECYRAIIVASDPCALAVSTQA